MGSIQTLLKLGITEELVKDEYNQYRRQLYCGKRKQNGLEIQVRELTEEIDLLREEIVDELADQLSEIEVELEEQRGISEKERSVNSRFETSQ